MCALLFQSRLQSNKIESLKGEEEVVKEETCFIFDLCFSSQAVFHKESERLKIKITRTIGRVLITTTETIEAIFT